jgi:hypothetical protein|tara:strand:- start:4328 stop:4612 length:285 start_codon:yes stop_codon:yes gene_type:complete
MNKGYQILMARIGSHPEEFFTDDWGGGPARESRWHKEIYALLDPAESGSIISEDERSALKDKMQAIIGEEFTKNVMDKLLETAYLPKQKRRVRR